MKSIVFAASLLIVCSSYCQVFSIKGLVVGKFPLRPVAATYTIPLTSTKLDPAQVKNLKRELSAMLQKAIDNLEDTNAYYRAFYTMLWSEDSVDDMLDDFRELKWCLDHPVYTTTRSFSFTPSPKDLEDNLFNVPVYEVTANTEGGMRKINYVATEPVKRWLISRLWFTMNRTYSYPPIMNMDYRMAWRELESDYKKASAYLKTINELAKRYTTCTDPIISEIESFAAKDWDQNPVVQELQNNDLYKQWLWYTAGILQMNPFMSTDNENLFPDSGSIAFLSESDKNEIYTSNSANYKKAITTKKTINELIVPINDKTVKKTRKLIQYDANNKYKAPDKSIPEKISNRDDLLVFVHNLPRGTSVAIKAEEPTKLVDQSDAAIELGEIVGTIGNLIKVATPAIPGIGVVSGFLNPTRYQISQLHIEVPKKNKEATTGERTESMMKANIRASDSSIFDNETLVKFYQKKITEEKLNVIEVNGQRVVVTKTTDIDKENFILASFMIPEDNDCSPCHWPPKFLIDSFLNHDKCYPINYTTLTDTKNSANLVIKRFGCYLEYVNECLDHLETLYQQVEDQQRVLLPFLKIINRSLPPQNLIPITDDAPPLYRTEYLYLKLPEAPIIHNYSISETIEKTDKKEATTKTVVNQSVKIGKMHYVDIGAGLSFTTSNYYVTQKGSNSLPETVEGEPFRFVAGLHFYPWGIFKLDNRLIGAPVKNRSSLFVGISIPESLENFYVAYSYDVVPGFKAMIGCHLYTNKRFTIVNNQITEEATGINIAGPFLGFNVDPTSIFSILGFVKK